MTLLPYSLAGAVFISGALIYLIKINQEKEYREIDAKPASSLFDSEEKIRTYTKGNYAKDIKELKRLYETAQTIPERKELISICIKLQENMSKIEMMGRSSFNGRMWEGLNSTSKICNNIIKYNNWGLEGLNELRDTLTLSLNYYNNDTENTLLGVSANIRTNYQRKYAELRRTRMSSYKRNSIIKKDLSERKRLAKLGKWKND